MRNCQLHRNDTTKTGILSAGSKYWPPFVFADEGDPEVDTKDRKLIRLIPDSILTPKCLIQCRRLLETFGCILALRTL